MNNKDNDCENIIPGVLQRPMAARVPSFFYINLFSS